MEFLWRCEYFWNRRVRMGSLYILVVSPQLNKTVCNLWKKRGRIGLKYLKAISKAARETNACQVYSIDNLLVLIRSITNAWCRRKVHETKNHELSAGFVSIDIGANIHSPSEAELYLINTSRLKWSVLVPCTGQEFQASIWNDIERKIKKN